MDTESKRGALRRIIGTSLSNMEHAISVEYVAVSVIFLRKKKLLTNIFSHMKVHAISSLEDISGREWGIFVCTLVFFPRKLANAI